MTKHGKALETLRNDAGMSRGDLCRELGWERSQYHRICVKSKRGPTIKILSQLLFALEATWTDWGDAFGAPEKVVKIVRARRAGNLRGHGALRKHKRHVG